MAIYKIQNNTTNQLKLKEKGFGNEFGLRDFFAAGDNLLDVFGIHFLEKEYQIPSGRIDTLGIDEEGYPVIIEYKLRDNEDMLSQGLYYLEWLKNNKSHFNLLVKDKLGKEVEVDWDRPRVILIAQGFSKYLLSAVNTVQNVELKTYHLYEGDILQIENVSENKIKTKNNDSKILSINDKEKNHSFDYKYHTSLVGEKLLEKFESIRDILLELPEVEEIAEQKSGITYRSTKSFAKFEFRKTFIRLLVRQPRYTMDTENLVRDITGHNWGYLGAINITEDTNINKIIEIVKESYNSTL